MPSASAGFDLIFFKEISRVFTFLPTLLIKQLPVFCFLIFRCSASASCDITNMLPAKMDRIGVMQEKKVIFADKE